MTSMMFLGCVLMCSDLRGHLLELSSLLIMTMISLSCKMPWTFPAAKPLGSKGRIWWHSAFQRLRRMASSWMFCTWRRKHKNQSNTISLGLLLGVCWPQDDGRCGGLPTVENGSGILQDSSGQVWRGSQACTHTKTIKNTETMLYSVSGWWK